MKSLTALYVLKVDAHTAQPQTGRVSKDTQDCGGGWRNLSRNSLRLLSARQRSDGT
jgi:hypothetical protein